MYQYLAYQILLHLAEKSLGSTGQDYFYYGTGYNDDISIYDKLLNSFALCIKTNLDKKDSQVLSSLLMTLWCQNDMVLEDYTWTTKNASPSMGDLYSYMREHSNGIVYEYASNGAFKGAGNIYRNSDHTSVYRTGDNPEHYTVVYTIEKILNKPEFWTE